MKRRDFVLTSAGIAGGIGVYTYSTTPKISASSIESVEKPSISAPLESNQYVDIPINPFDIKGKDLSTSNDITIDYELRRTDDSAVSTATESVNVPTSGSFTVNTQGRDLRLENSDISGGSEDFYIYVEITHSDTDDVTGQSASFTVQKSGAFFNVKITSSSTPVDVGNTLTVYYEVENTGTKSDTQTIRLDVGGNQRDSNNETVASGNTITGSLLWNTSSGDAGDYTATVSSSEISDSVSVSVDSITPSRSDAVDASKAWYVPKNGGEFKQISSTAPSNYPDTIPVTDGSYNSNYFGNGLDAIVIDSQDDNLVKASEKIYESEFNSGEPGPSDMSIAQYTKYISGNQFTTGLVSFDRAYSSGISDGDEKQSLDVSLIANAYPEQKSVGGQISDGEIQYIHHKRSPDPMSWTLSGPNLGTAEFSQVGFENEFVKYNIQVFKAKGAVAEFSITETDSVPNTVKDYFEGNY